MLDQSVAKNLFKREQLEVPLSEAAGSSGPKNGPNGHTDGPDASARLFAQDLSRLV
jgi:hypothetical protein